MNELSHVLECDNISNIGNCFNDTTLYDCNLYNSSSYDKIDNAYKDKTIHDNSTYYQVSSDDNDNNHGINIFDNSTVNDSYQEILEDNNESEHYEIDNDDTSRVDSVSLATNIDGDFRNLSCIAVNVCGFKSKEMYPDFIQFIRQHDIICISESKLEDTDCVKIEGYTAFYKNRYKFKKKSGDILVLI